MASIRTLVIIVSLLCAVLGVVNGQAHQGGAHNQGSGPNQRLFRLKRQVNDETGNHPNLQTDPAPESTNENNQYSQVNVNQPTKQYEDGQDIKNNDIQQMENSAAQENQDNHDEQANQVGQVGQEGQAEGIESTQNDQEQKALVENNQNKPDEKPQNNKVGDRISSLGKLSGDNDQKEQEQKPQTNQDKQTGDKQHEQSGASQGGQSDQVVSNQISPEGQTQEPQSQGITETNHEESVNYNQTEQNEDIQDNVSTTENPNPNRPSCTTCTFGVDPILSCGDCNTRVICKPVGALVLKCRNPFRPYCNRGICSPFPSQMCLV